MRCVFNYFLGIFSLSFALAIGKKLSKYVAIINWWLCAENARKFEEIEGYQ